ncbi:MAG: phosphatidate cytidylyltransferase [Bacteroidetes bacterium]|nr:phosphatidate cytidylyltransferase [Bacteroidota bacterium]
MSNTLTRILVGIAGIPLVLFIVYYGGYPFFAFCLLVEILALYELLKMFRVKGYEPLTVISLVFSAGVFTGFIFARSYIEYTLLLIGVVFIIELFRGGKKNIFNPLLFVFGLIYITLPLALLYELGRNYILVYYILALIWSCDSFAFFGGKFFGKHKLSSISPKKTIEGSAAGFVFTVIMSVVFHFIFPETISVKDSVMVGALTGVLAQAGDLVESFLKRYTGVKDSSNIIPGHGGVLDRFDSLIFCAPVVYVYFHFFKIFIN